MRAVYGRTWWMGGGHHGIEWRVGALLSRVSHIGRCSHGHDGNNNWLLGLDVVVVRQRQREDVVGLPYLCKQRTHNIIQIHKNVLRD